MPQSLSIRLAEALNVSPAFDNCFFHSYATHLLANKLPLPKDLFTFKSIMGPESPASQLQQRFPNQESLSLFAEYAQRHHPEQAPLSPNFIVEKTLVLGFLMREWFATQLSKNFEVADNIQKDVVKYFKIYIDYRWDEVEAATLLDGPNGCLYTANKQFLEYFTSYNPHQKALTAEEARFKKYFTDAEQNEEKAIAAYWKAEGYQKYFSLIANPSTKLAYHEVVPVLQMLGQSLTIYDAKNNSLVYSQKGNEELPEMEVKLNADIGHYFLLKTDETSSLLDEYQLSYQQYIKDREEVLKVEGNKDLAANTKPSLLVGAICPEGHLSKPTFALLLDKVDHLQEFVDEHQEAQLLAEQQRQLIEQERQRQLDVQEQQRKFAEQEQQRKFAEQEQQRKFAEQEQQRLFAEQVQQRKLVVETIPQQKPQVSEAEENFTEHLRLLNVKIEHLQSRKDNAERSGDTKASERLEKARNAAFDLHQDLKAAGEIYFNKPTQVNYKKFKKECDTHIQTARGVLDKHRGWSEFLINLGLGLATAGLGVLIKGLINVASDRSFFFVHKTDSSKHVDEIEKDINNAAPGA